MSRWLVLAALAALVSACGTFDGRLPGDPPREVLGVSAAAAPSGAATMAQAVATNERSANQICTRGYERLRQDTVAASAGAKLVDWHVRCRPYVFSMFGVPLGNSLSDYPF